MGDENPICTLGDYSKPSHEGYRNTIELPVGNNVVPLRFDTIRQTIDQSIGVKLRDLNAEESWALLEDLSLYDNESWNDPRDFTKPVKAIALPQDVPSTFVRHLIEFENQVQRLMEAHLALTQPTQVNKITTPCEIYSGPHDTQYCMENPEQAFVDYASSRTDEAGAARLSKFEADFKRQQGEMTKKIDTVLKSIVDQIAGTLPSDMVKNPKLGTYLVSSARSYPTMDPQCSTQIYNSINLGLVPPSPNAELVCTKEEDGDVMFVEIIPKDDSSHKEEPEAEVMDIRKRMNNEAKRTKPSTGMERVPVIRGLDVASNQGSRSIAWRIIKIEGPGMVDEERPKVMDPSPHPYIRRPPYSLRSRLVLAYF
ncbi:hypothetical protein Tco_1357927 [Tanacetum coccineum]